MQVIYSEVKAPQSTPESVRLRTRAALNAAHCVSLHLLYDADVQCSECSLVSTSRSVASLPHNSQLLSSGCTIRAARNVTGGEFLSICASSPGNRASTARVFPPQTPASVLGFIHTHIVFNAGREHARCLWSG